MTRWRRPGAGEILLVYLLLGIVDLLLIPRLRPVSSHDMLRTSLAAVFLTWRVSRGGWISRAILVFLSLVFYAGDVLAIARSWDLTVVALVIIDAAQVLLLISPPVYGRTRRPRPVQVRASGWASLVRRPPMWLLPWGLIAGLLLTLACLGGQDFVAIPGCRPAASDTCTAVAEGYPLHWLTAVQNVPVISKGALLKDCVQWVLACMSVLYLVWLQLTPPPDW